MGRRTKQSPGGFRQIPGLVLAPPLTPSPPPPQPRPPPFDLHPVLPFSLQTLAGQALSRAQASHVLLGSGRQQSSRSSPVWRPQSHALSPKKGSRGPGGDGALWDPGHIPVRVAHRYGDRRTQRGPMQPQTLGRRAPPHKLWRTVTLEDFRGHYSPSPAPALSLTQLGRQAGNRDKRNKLKTTRDSPEPSGPVLKRV